MLAEVRRFIKRVYESPEYQPILPEGFLPEARKFYYDCAQSPDAPQMASLRAVVPASQILFDTDYNRFPMTHSAKLRGGLKLPNDVRRGIERDNAIRLFPRLA